MRKMKSIISLILVCVMMLSFMSINVHATKTTHIDDDFYGDQINEDVWDTSGGASIVNKGGAIQIKGGDFSTCVGWKGLRDNID